MILAFLALLSSAPAAEVAGPWAGGAWVDLAVAGPDVHAVWLQGGELWYAKLTNGVAGPAERVASGVAAVESCAVRPEVVVSAGAPVVMYSTEAALFRAERRNGVWAGTVVSPPGATGPFAAAIVAKPGGGAIVAGIDGAPGHPDLFVDGKVVVPGGASGGCPCCRPALAARGSGFALAFRGLAPDIRLFESPDGSTWNDAGLATHGGWTASSCAGDGPALSDTTLVVSDGRSGGRVVYEVDRYGEHPQRPATAGAPMLEPQTLPDASLVTWVEVSAAGRALVVRDGPSAPAVVVTSKTELHPGEPVVVGSEVWLPWQGDTAHVERWESQAPPGF